VFALHAVAFFEAGKPVPLHGAGESATFHRADDVDRLNLIEELNRQDGAELMLDRSVLANLFDVSLGRRLRLFNVAEFGLADALLRLSPTRAPPRRCKT
jgi:hypothetical protein